ncbi:mucin-5AC [Nocardioides sp. Soil797]|nr:mucin-5AC [Nocardioides sp. Soil797]
MAPLAHALAVDDEGVRVAGSGLEPLVLSLDGQYLWSLTPARDGQLGIGGWRVPWPEVLRPHLRGRARVTVTGPSGDAAFDRTVSLGGGDDPIRVVDSSGHPLCVDKVGHLTRSFAATDVRIREEILAGTGRALRHLREECGVEGYLNYGLLLGAVRDGTMIAHDSDADLCYLSRQTSPADVIAESFRIERRLRSLGWRLLRMSGGDIKLLLPLSDGRQCHIDIFVAFRIDGIFYQLGNRSGWLADEVIVPTSTVELHGHRFAAPADPAAMLEFIYGPRWRTPDPSFKYADRSAGVRRLDGWLRGFRTDMGRWSEFFQSPLESDVPRRGSEFARWVHRRLDKGAAVADLGAGSGRDAIHFAAVGREVRAYDFSRVSRRIITQRSRRRKQKVDVQPLILGELRTVLAVGADLARHPHHLYARHLLGCLDDTARANLWLLCRMALRNGTSLFLEFAATTDTNLQSLTSEQAIVVPAPAPTGLVRRLDVDAIQREVELAGGTVAFVETGPGTDMFDAPDPLVCRMRITWAPTPADEKKRNR